VIPGFFIKKSYGDYAVGFGNYIPFAGGGVKYDDFYPQGYDMESFAGFSAFTAAVAYKISTKLSIGAGASIYYGAMGSKELQEIAPDIYMNIESEYEGLAGYGGNFGLMYKFSEEFYAGASVMSKIPIELDGEVEVVGIDGGVSVPRSINDSDVEFTLPYIIKIGIGYKPNNSGLTLCMVIGYFMWGDLDKIKITTAGTLEEVKTNYTNSYVLGAGMEYKLSDKFTLRSGLYYTERAIKKEENNPAFSDFNRLNPSVGIAYNFSDSIEINVNGNYTYAFEEKFNDSKLKQRNMILLTGVRFKF
jgi:long-chain fatty acid transport protein